MIDDFRRPPPPRPPVRLKQTDLQPQYKPAAPVKPVSNQSEPAFRPPEEVADSETANDAFPVAETTTAPQTNATKRFSRSRLTKNQKIIVIAVLILLVAAAGTAYAVTRPSAKKPVVAQAIKPVAVKPVVSPLTGIPVTKDQQKLPVTAVMIENSPDARPQSGLKDAGIVFEAIAEGGITRFMALYQESVPGNVGPIRSSRPYYLQWALPFQASYAHVGGSPDALNDIKTWNVRDLDQMYNAGSYHRISTRYAPHNVYTGIAQLQSLENAKGYSTSTFTSLPRKAEAKSAAPNATSIDFAISGAYYNVHYDYDAAANAYKRSEGGAPHKDFDSGTQLEPKVVVGLVMPYSVMADGYHSQYNTIGSGRMYVFQDGIFTTGTWTKADNNSQFVFKDDSGKILALNPGQTWITALGSTTNITYK